MRRRGFSLLEVLVAVGLLALLSALVYSFMWELFDRRTRALAVSERTQVATILFDRLEHDLMTVLASAGDQAGLIGDEGGLTIFTRGVLIAPGASPRSDLQRTAIRFDGARGVLEIRRDGNPGEGETRGGGGDEGIAGVVRAVRFRYHDGSAWTGSFESGRGLPAAVEVSIWFGRSEPGPDERPTDRDEFPVGGEDPLFVPDPGFEPGPEDRAAPPPPPADRVRVIAIPDGGVRVGGAMP
jgi:prepilin-type N-terminal cleavage/methylation domain-containing protein